MGVRNGSNIIRPLTAIRVAATGLMASERHGTVNGTGAAIVSELVFARVGLSGGKPNEFETAPLEIAAELNENSEALPLKFSVPLAELQPGRYTCQASVLDLTGTRQSGKGDYLQ